jgi:hypothetical protein
MAPPLQRPISQCFSGDSLFILSIMQTPYIQSVDRKQGIFMVKRVICTVTTAIYLVPRSRLVVLFLHSPIRLQGLVLN